MRLKGIGQPLAIFDVDARHRRQILHGDVRRDLACADDLLNLLGEKFNQSQAAAHPTRAAIEAARQFVQAVAEAVPEFLKPPSFLQRRIALAEAHRTFQD